MLQAWPRLSSLISLLTPHMLRGLTRSLEHQSEPALPACSKPASGSPRLLLAGLELAGCHARRMFVRSCIYLPKYDL
jgi:hypothetical protein